MYEYVVFEAAFIVCMRGCGICRRQWECTVNHCVEGHGSQTDAYQCQGDVDAVEDWPFLWLANAVLAH